MSMESEDEIDKMYHLLLEKISCNDQEEISTFLLVKYLGIEREESLLPVQGRKSTESSCCCVHEAYSAGTRFTPDQFVPGLFQRVGGVGNNVPLVVNAVSTRDYCCNFFPLVCPLPCVSFTLSCFAHITSHVMSTN